MTKISTFVPDTEINGKDKLIGTDYNNAQKTKNFKVEDLGTHFNLVNGSRNFEYLFYNHLSISQAPVDGAFYANGNEQDPNNITHFFISKKTSNNKDVSSFFDSITAENPFDLIISQSTDLNTIFFFNISDVESINGYYKLTVSEVFFPQGKTLEFMASNVIFNLKANSESIHNNLSGLNDGDYKHLTALEKNKFDNLPSSFVANHSQLTLDDGTNPHGTTKSDVGLSEVNNTSDADKPISTAQQTALNLKQDNLTETNFGTFSNGLTTNDSIVDSDLINYTDVSDSNKQKKTTWFNIKAKLTTVFNDLFVSKVTTNDVEKVYIKNADGTQGMKPVSELLSEVLSNDETTYTAATLPLAGTELALVEQGGTFKTVAVSEFGGGGGGDEFFYIHMNQYVQYSQAPTTWFARSVGPQNVGWHATANQHTQNIGTNPLNFAFQSPAVTLPFDCEVEEAFVTIQNSNMLTRTLNLRFYAYDIVSNLPANIQQVLNITTLSVPAIKLITTDYTIPANTFTKWQRVTTVTNQSSDLTGAAVSWEVLIKLKKI